MMELEDKVQLATKATVNHDQCIRVLQGQVVNLEARSMKQNIVITGIQEDRDENCKQEVKDFFKT